MDLSTVIQEFEAYYELKFGRKPRLVRKVLDHDNKTLHHAGAARRSSISAPGRGEGQGGQNSRSSKGTSKRSGTAASQSQTLDDKGEEDEGGGGGFLSIQGNGKKKMLAFDDDDVHGEGSNEQQPRPLRPLPHELLQDAELRALANTITRDVLQYNPGVKWDDIVGLDSAKRLLDEAVVMPINYPSIFQGLLSPWGGILLYGPPGKAAAMYAQTCRMGGVCTAS